MIRHVPHISSRAEIIRTAKLQIASAITPNGLIDNVRRTEKDIGCHRDAFKLVVGVGGGTEEDFQSGAGNGESGAARPPDRTHRLYFERRLDFLRYGLLLEIGQ